jgi:hypothetical protein
MTTRRRKEVDPNAEPEINLDDLLSEGGNAGGPYWGSADSHTCIRLIHTVTTLGGFVTFWTDGTNQRLSFSVRVGTGKRSYDLEEAEQFIRIAESVIGKLSPSLLSRKKPGPPLPNHLDNPPVKGK